MQFYRSVIGIIIQHLAMLGIALHYTLSSGNASYLRVYTKQIECRTSYNLISSAFSYTRILEYVTLQNVKSIQIKTRSIVIRHPGLLQRI